MFRFAYAVLGLVVGLVAIPQPIHVAAFTPVRTPDGTACDIPLDQHMQNTGGSDGLGLCVFTSVEIASRWQNVRELFGFRKWMESRPGGGWPQKLDRELAHYCRARGVEIPRYIQHTGGDMKFLDLVVKTRRMAAVTYCGLDDFYRDRLGRPALIAHMVNLTHLTSTSAAIVDNNRAGWVVGMSRSEFAERWKGNGGGWAFVLLAPPPPPGGGVSASVGQCPDGRCPLRPTPIVGPTNFGIEPRMIDGTKPRYWINGQEVSAEVAYAAVGDDLVDDSDRYHLSLVVSEYEMGRAAQILRDPRLAKLLAKCHVQVYPPDSWTAKTRLTSRVTLQAPASRGGKVLGRSDQLDAAELLAMLGPVLDPDQRTPAPMPHTPTPRPVDPEPAPCPCPGPCPCPLPCPCPDAPIEDPGAPQPDCLLCLCALAVAWFFPKR